MTSETDLEQPRHTTRGRPMSLDNGTTPYPNPPRSINAALPIIGLGINEFRVIFIDTFPTYLRIRLERALHLSTQSSIPFALEPPDAFLV